MMATRDKDSPVVIRVNKTTTGEAHRRRYAPRTKLECFAIMISRVLRCSHRYVLAQGRSLLPRWEKNGVELMCYEISLDDLEGNNKHQRAEKKKKRTRIKKHLICLRACILWPACLCNSSYSPSKPYVLAHVVRLLILYSLDSRPAELSFSLFLFFHSPSYPSSSALHMAISSF